MRGLSLYSDALGVQAAGCRPFLTVMGPYITVSTTQVICRSVGIGAQGRLPGLANENDLSTQCGLSAYLARTC